MSMDIRTNGATSSCSFSCTYSSTLSQIQSLVPNSRSNSNNPHPTTFVTVDASFFKQVVQMLTESPRTSKSVSKQPTSPTTPNSKNDVVLPPSSSRSFVIPTIKTTPNKKQQQGFNLYERQNNLKHRLLMISPQNTSFPSSRKPSKILSPSVLDFPSLTLSPITPLSVVGDDDRFDKSSHSSAEEERAIAEKGFYLHPSPMSTPRDVESQLLPLFPVTSSRVLDPTS